MWPGGAGLKEGIIKPVKYKSSKGKEIQIFRYKTAEEVLAALWGVDAAELDELSFGGYDGDGKEYNMPFSEILANIKETGCYGFAGKKKEIHLWIDKSADPEDVINLIAHERGHLIRPFHRDEMKEEMKACRYGDTAAFAYQVMKDLMQ